MHRLFADCDWYLESLCNSKILFRRRNWDHITWRDVTLGDTNFITLASLPIHETQNITKMLGPQPSWKIQKIPKNQQRKN